MLNNVESICVWYGYDGQKYEWQQWMTAQFMMDDARQIIWELGMMMLLEYWIYYSVLSSDYYVRMYGKKYTNVINWTYVQNSEFNFERWKRTNGKNAHSYQANLHRNSFSCGYCYRQQIVKNTNKKSHIS